MKLKDSELKNILKEVEQEFQTMLKSEQADLKKAAGDDKPDEAGSASSGGDASAPAPEASSAPAEASAPAEGSAPEASASAPADASASPAPEASGSAPVDPAAQAAPADPEALKAEYSKLDPESLKAHYMAAKAALFELMGASGEASPEASASAPPMAPPGPEASASAAPPPAAPPPAMKAEVPASIKNIPATADTDDAGSKGGKGALHDVKALGKSEAEVAKDQKIGDLEKQVELLAKAVELSLGTPMRKAITSVAHIAKTEEAPAVKAELTKSEVQEKIKKAMAGGKLTKSQKDSLFSFTLGNTEFDKIKDLLA